MAIFTTVCYVWFTRNHRRNFRQNNFCEAKNFFRQQKEKSFLEEIKMVINKQCNNLYFIDNKKEENSFPEK